MNTIAFIRHSRPASALAAALVVVLALAALAGCRSDKSELTARQAALLAAIPADTPYLLASLEPFPRDFRTLLGEQLLPAAAAQFTAGMTGEAEPFGQGLIAFYQALAAVYDPERAKTAGLDDEVLWALYGAPQLPVFRHEVRDTSRAESWVLEQFRKAGAEPTAIEIGGAAAYKLPADGAALYFRFTDRHATYALLPDRDDSPALELALGLTVPSPAMDAAALTAQAGKDGRPLYEFGYVLPPALASGLLAADGPFTTEIATDPEWAALTAPPCQDELGELLGLMPRLDFALTSAGRRQMTMVSDITFRPDLAADFIKMSGGAPDLEAGGAPFQTSLSLRLGALRDFVLRLARDTNADPWTCPPFSYLNSTAEQIVTAANTPIPPAVGNLHGISLALDRLPGDFSAEPDSLGHLTVHIDHPALLYGMAQMFVPALAAVELTAGGDPVPLPDTLTGLSDPPVFAAMSDHAIGLARGEAAVLALPSRLGSLPEGSRTLAAYGFDYRLLGDVIDKAMIDYAARAGEEAAATCAPDCPVEEDLTAEQQATLASMHRLLALLDREHLVVRAGDRGLRLEQTVTFAAQ